eukprot:284816957_1
MMTTMLPGGAGYSRLYYDRRGSTHIRPGKSKISYFMVSQSHSRCRYCCRAALFRYSSNQFAVAASRRILRASPRYSSTRHQMASAGVPVLSRHIVGVLLQRVLFHPDKPPWSKVSSPFPLGSAYLTSPSASVIKVVLQMICQNKVRLFRDWSAPATCTTSNIREEAHDLYIREFPFSPRHRARIFPTYQSSCELSTGIRGPESSHAFHYIIYFLFGITLVIIQVCTQASRFESSYLIGLNPDSKGGLGSLHAGYMLKPVNSCAEADSGGGVCLNSGPDMRHERAGVTKIDGAFGTHEEHGWVVCSGIANIFARSVPDESLMTSVFSMSLKQSFTKKTATYCFPLIMNSRDAPILTVALGWRFGSHSRPSEEEIGGGSNNNIKIRNEYHEDYQRQPTYLLKDAAQVYWLDLAAAFPEIPGRWRIQRRHLRLEKEVTTLAAVPELLYWPAAPTERCRSIWETARAVDYSPVHVPQSGTCEGEAVTRQRGLTKNNIIDLPNRSMPTGKSNLVRHAQPTLQKTTEGIQTCSYDFSLPDMCSWWDSRCLTNKRWQLPAANSLEIPKSLVAIGSKLTSTQNLLRGSGGPTPSPGWRLRNILWGGGSNSLYIRWLQDVKATRQSRDLETGLTKLEPGNRLENRRRSQNLRALIFRINPSSKTP